MGSPPVHLPAHTLYSCLVTMSFNNLRSGITCTCPNATRKQARESQHLVIRIHRTHRAEVAQEAHAALQDRHHGFTMVKKLRFSIEDVDGARENGDRASGTREASNESDCMVANSTM